MSLGLGVRGLEGHLFVETDLGLERVEDVGP